MRIYHIDKPSIPSNNPKTLFLPLRRLRNQNQTKHKARKSPHSPTNNHRRSKFFHKKAKKRLQTNGKNKKKHLQAPLNDLTVHFIPNNARTEFAKQKTLRFELKF